MKNLHIILAVGQVWQHPRMDYKRAEIIELEPGRVRVKALRGGRRSWISRESFTVVVPERNRWIFVRDAPGERAKLG